jgi:hypothetical protein
MFRMPIELVPRIPGRYQVMSVLYKQHSKLESYKEQGLPVEKWVYDRDSLTKKLVREG